MISEDKIIQILQESSHGFIGDDAAILPPITNNNRYVVAKDLLVENVHFRIKYFSPQDLAHKALHVNLSDLAAMGAKPLFILCGISIPEHLQNYSCKFLNALTKACQNVNVILIGGDTTTSKSELFISITAVGEAQESQIKYRNKASNKDVICVVGNLGYAHLGLNGLENAVPTQAKFSECFLRPTAKINEGIWLGQQPFVSSMMDISDGLYIDLKRLCQASNLGATIDIDLLKAVLDPEISVQTALEGGEDYGLLICIKHDEYEQFAQKFKKNFGYALKKIGEINNENVVSLKKSGKNISLTINSFTHFGELL